MSADGGGAGGSGVGGSGVGASEVDGLHDTQFDVRVLSRTEAADDVVVFELAAPDGPTDPGAHGATLPGWTAGSHIDLVLPDGEVRQYSLVGPPSPGHADTWRIAVLHEPDGRGGSAWLHSSLHEGDTVTVAGPRNHFEFEPVARHVLRAGGRRHRGHPDLGDGRGRPPGPASPYERALRRALAVRRWRCSTNSKASTGDGSKLDVYAGDEGARLDLDGLFAGMKPFTTTFCCGPVAPHRGDRASRVRDRQLVVERFEPKREVGEPVLDDPVRGRTRA